MPQTHWEVLNHLWPAVWCNPNRGPAIAADSSADQAHVNEQEPVQEKPANVPTIKAYNNARFLTGSIARHIRIMCELQEPLKRLTANGVGNYILFIGTHAVMHPDERAKHIEDLEHQVSAGGPRDELAALGAKIRFAKKLQPMDKWYVVAMELAEKIARWSQKRQAEGKSTYCVCTGGGPGVMEAANRGASSAGAMTLGLGSTRPEWGSMNPYVSQGGAFKFHYFFMRKFWMAYKCMGLVVLPGGYGMLDELFEFLQLVSTKKIAHKLPIIFFGKDHWKKAINFRYLVECGMMSQESVDIIEFMDTADEAFEYLVNEVNLANETGENSVVEDAKRRRLSPRLQGQSMPLFLPPSEQI